MIIYVISFVVVVISGLWFMSNRKRDKEIARLKDQRAAEAKARSKRNRRDAKNINPPSADSMRDGL